MNLRLAIVLLSFLLIAVFPHTFQAQKRVSSTATLERNIRAELGFLASDAMQGRGSGSGYERLAAEYIGSQFRQFGLEPAGDVDASGRQGFVQRATLAGLKFTEAPTLTITTGANVKKWVFGKDLLVSFLRSSRVVGALQIIDGNNTPMKGSVALIRLPESTDAQKRQEIVRKARSAQAAAVLLLETEANRKTREAGNVRLPNLGTRIQGDTSSDTSFVTISLSKEAFDSIATLAPGSRVEFTGPTQGSAETYTWNAIGVLRGSNPAMAKEVIMLSAHLDHLGTNENAAPGTDAIFNGADDDASGCVAVLELARAMASGRRPKRTVYFVCFGSEERGGYGAQFFVAHSPVPLEQVVADVTFEMLGRPDAKVAANTLWLTGYERSTLGPELAKHGALLVADPHPEQNFFQRSDNYTLALRGVVAHTVSSFGLHTDYHRPSDELSKVDFLFMTRAIASLIKPIRWLADSSFKPAWLPGQAPTRG
ncbi:MAG TPA: M20/M25/M40 family metallo-hydrolase [Pyrinomonadaceae bacterium]|nr:M20/M25/M40 family metallo-hydrolase [Pyrinomonadaceae bacterium]